jgi:hypothetical protein
MISLILAAAVALATPPAPRPCLIAPPPRAHHKRHRRAAAAVPICAPGAQAPRVIFLPAPAPEPDLAPIPSVLPYYVPAAASLYTPPPAYAPAAPSDCFAAGSLWEDLGYCLLPGGGYYVRTGYVPPKTPPRTVRPTYPTPPPTTTPLRTPEMDPSLGWSMVLLLGGLLAVLRGRKTKI